MNSLIKKKTNKIHPQVSSQTQYLIDSPRKKQVIKSIKEIAEEVITHNSQIYQKQLPLRLFSSTENGLNKQRDLDFQNRFSQDIFSDQNAIEQIIKSLKKGYFLKKHSINTREPHQKFVYLSQDEDFLCWKSPNKNDQKKISLTKIKSAEVGQLGSGLLKLNGAIYSQNCILIISSQRQLEFQAKNSEIIKLFGSQLQICIEIATKFRYRSLPLY